ncbi:PIG-P-domain-containing protein [Coprinellus micaceus]|uniref:PIG-P-domain-containing protein n=1 Tax=Coprinellus micaceus TaxID=71717 RepID=A0A4Y7SNB7_COPMI|nr:PIG-P-domain-containing protein [Coprinellus micaceus]
MAHNVHSSHEVRRRKGTLVQPSSPTSPLESEAHAHVQAQQLTWPPPEHRSRAPEFYGFVAWTSTYLLFVIYLLWAFLPDELIIWLGVTWYPNREWAILVPAWSIVAVLFTYFVYFALALRGTPPLDDINSITDGHALYPKPQGGTHNTYLAATELNVIPELYDIPISLVNRVLYHHDEQAASKQRHPATVSCDP